MLTRRFRDARTDGVARYAESCIFEGYALETIKINEHLAAKEMMD
jgi:hypothetical protein